MSRKTRRRSRRSERNSCAGKLAYSKVEAEQKATDHKQEGDSLWIPYRCRFCTCRAGVAVWHVGHLRLRKA